MDKHIALFLTFFVIAFVIGFLIGAFGEPWNFPGLGKIIPYHSNDTLGEKFVNGFVLGIFSGFAGACAGLGATQLGGA